MAPIPPIQQYHFTAGVVQERAQDEGIRWIFHTPYYPQANEIVECTNGLFKRNLKPHEPEWARGCQMGYIESVAAGEFMDAHNS